MPTVGRARHARIPCCMLKQTSLAALALTVLAAAGCTSEFVSESEGTACTLTGGNNGLFVRVPSSVAPGPGTVQVEICDSGGCADAITRLTRDDSPDRAVFASFDDLGRTFKPGSVQVAVEVRDRNDKLLASRESAVTLASEFPNGRDCGAADDFVSGELELGLADRRTS